MPRSRPEDPNPDPARSESSPSSGDSETIGHADGLRLGTAHDLQYLRPGKGWNSRAIKDYRSLNETTRKVDYSLLHESFVERVSSSEPVELNLGPTYRDDPFRNVPVTFPMGGGPGL